MRSAAAAALLWGWIVLNSATCSVSASGASKELIDEIVREHNKARSSVKPAASDMTDMTWDDSLANIAAEWAGRCLFEHNPDPGKNVPANPDISSIGENIWATSSPVFNATRAIQRWVDEKQQYDYSSDTCTKVCGHYTQVVWASSNKVGCGVNLCPNGVKSTAFSDKKGYIFVCNYAPAGNIAGMRPYVSGEAGCSDCEGPCDGRPCFRSAGIQDQQIFVTASNLNYVVILIVRPLGLIATFLAAYAVRHFYPNVFCYE